MKVFLKSRCALTAILIAMAVTPSALAQSTERVSVTSDEQQVWNYSGGPSVNADGTIVAFDSYAHRLAAGDTNGFADVFVRNRQKGITTRVSRSSTGQQANNESRMPSISGDGRFVAFHSYASNLVAGDSNAVRDVFIRDRSTQTTERVSLSAAGLQANAESNTPAISGDGRYVVFQSFASNLVVGDTNATTDVFVRDRIAGTTERVSVSTAGTQSANFSGSPTISRDGRWIGFQNPAGDLVTNDTNDAQDAFVHDQVTSITERVSISSAGVQGDNDSFAPAVSSDGHFAVFGSWATNLVSGDTNDTLDCFVRDRVNGTTERVSVASDGGQGNSASVGCRISADGRYVAFSSAASNLVAGDTNNAEDVFVRDRIANTTVRASVSSAGSEANAGSFNIAFSSDGRHVAFQSEASNLVADDTNRRIDVFIRDLGP